LGIEFGVKNVELYDSPIHHAMKKYADLHCHPHSRAFHWMRHTKNEKRPSRFNPWNVVLSNFNKQEKGKRAFSYSQCDPAKLWNGETKLVFASLYPFEKGFYKGGEIDQSKLIRMLDVLSTSGLGFLNPIKWVQALFAFVTGAPTILKIARAFLQSLLMRMPIRRIKYFISSEYDYYDELIRERDFLLSHSDELTTNKIYIPGIKCLFKSASKLRKKYPESLNATGKYTVCENYNEVQTTLDADNIAMVLTIEGMHALGTDTALGKVEERIMELKNWQKPVFFITFAHHFNNYLGGHAHSIPDALRILSDQSEGMDEGIKPAGEKAIKLLLGLDDELKLNPSLGRRILVDLKHTAAKTRKWYYEQIVTPCMAKGDTIPVILSHVGFSGWDTLQETIDYSFHENDFELKDGFYPWNINACGEDVVWVAKTGGLMGLCFDQRILGDKKDKVNSIDLLWKNLKAMVDQIISSEKLSEDQKSNCWSYFTLGTDFEGYIDPTQDYGNSLLFDDFEKDLFRKIHTLMEIDGAKYYLEDDAKVETAVRGICFENAHQFLKRNF
jgi:microsomal dipeptidase-like Zn-dependent dipeptidase